MTMTDLNHYRAATDTTEEYLGRVVWFSQRERTIAHSTLDTVLTAHGLGKYTPGVPADVDVFRRVTSAAKRTKEPTDREGVFQNLHVAKLADDDTELVRRFVVEEVDPKGRALAYRECYDLIFDKATGRVTTKEILQLRPDGHPIAHYQPDYVAPPELATKGVQEARSTFESLRGHVNADALRTIANRIIDGGHAVKLRETGAVYFVPKAHTGELDQLIAAAKQLPGLKVDAIKLTDEGDGAERDRVRSAADDDLSGRCRAMQAELATLAGDQTEVGKRKRESVWRAYRTLAAQISAHEELLQETLQRTQIEFSQLEYSVLQAVGEAGTAA